jgi:hypothetical protein
LYAASPFEPVTGNVPGAVKRRYGPWWLVGFCGNGGSIEVSVAVSSLATELSVENGRINFGRSDGNEFFTLGVPPEWDSPAGLSPERAVMRMSHRTRRRINDVPALIAADPRVSYPQGAVWRVGLESPVRLHASKSKRVLDADAVYAGLHEDVGKKPRELADDALVLRVPASEQPSEFQSTFSYFENGARLTDRPVSGVTTVRRRADSPIVFEPATSEEP